VAYVSLSVKDSENPKWIACREIDHEIREDSVEEDVPAGKIGALMSAVRNSSYFVEPSEKFCNDAASCLLTLSFQQVKPDRVDIENGIFGEPK
jgi:hypothetical protein